MDDILALLTSLKRPGLLIRAARFGVESYQRERDLAALIGQPDPSRAQALRALTDREAEMDARRRAGHADYAASTHIRLLSAIMAEADRAQEERPPRPRAQVVPHLVEVPQV